MAIISLVGRLGADPALKFFESGSSVCEFRVGDISKRGEESPTNWFNCKLWGKRAQLFADSVKKGQRIQIWGEVCTEEWIDKVSGEKADKQVIVVANFNYIEKAPEGSWGNNQSSSGSTLTEDIPF
tara:strand:- start:2216 stop:2593 length:378 start_codon:yes stop_codon:yes gene_type:complete